MRHEPPASIVPMCYAISSLQLSPSSSTTHLSVNGPRPPRGGEQRYMEMPTSRWSAPGISPVPLTAPAGRQRRAVRRMPRRARRSSTLVVLINHAPRPSGCRAYSRIDLVGNSLSLGMAPVRLLHALGLGVYQQRTAGVGGIERKSTAASWSFSILSSAVVRHCRPSAWNRSPAQPSTNSVTFDPSSLSKHSTRGRPRR